MRFDCGGGAIETQCGKICSGVLTQLNKRCHKNPLHMSDQVKPQTLSQVEIAHIVAVLRHYRGNMTASADALGVDRRTLYRKVRADPEARTLIQELRLASAKVPWQVRERPLSEDGVRRLLAEALEDLKRPV